MYAKKKRTHDSTFEVNKITAKIVNFESSNEFKHLQNSNQVRVHPVSKSKPQLKKITVCTKPNNSNLFCFSFSIDKFFNKPQITIWFSSVTAFTFFSDVQKCRKSTHPFPLLSQAHQIAYRPDLYRLPILRKPDTSMLLI